MTAMMRMRDALATYVETNVDTNLCHGGQSITQAIFIDGHCGSGRAASLSTRETIRRMLLPTLLIISGVGGRLAELVDGELG